MQLARLADADWKGGDGAIRVDDRLSLDELAGSRTLHDARVLLDILAAPEGVKATPKGNLPRRVVEEFRARMRPPAHRHDAWEAEATVRNEEDLWALHVVRVLLELGGLVKRRRGAWSRTRRGSGLAAPDRAGALHALLLRTHFRALDLAYLDGAPHVPLFQATVGIPLYRLTQLDDGWRAPDALVDLLIPPDLRADLRRAMDEGLARSLGFDGLPLIMDTRLLRPLARFGLLDQREPARDRAREVGSAILRDEYRTTPLLARALHFDLADAGA